jgi:hypothetical protein
MPDLGKVEGDLPSDKPDWSYSYNKLINQSITAAAAGSERSLRRQQRALAKSLASDPDLLAAVVGRRTAEGRSQAGRSWHAVLG